MINPIQEQYRIGYRYGVKTFYSDRHLGVDFIIKTGAKIYAPEDGTITRRFTASQGGNTLWLESSKYIHRFMHLDTFNVTALSRVKSSNIIGTVGNTGMSTASHLHWDLWDKKNGQLNPNNFRGFVDPLIFKLESINNNNNSKLMTRDNFVSIIRQINRGDFESNTNKTPHINVDHYFNEYLKNPNDFENIMDSIIRNIYDIKNKQGIRFMDAKEIRWRTEADIKGK